VFLLSLYVLSISVIILFTTEARNARSLFFFFTVFSVSLWLYLFTTEAQRARSCLSPPTKDLIIRPLQKTNKHNYLLKKDRIHKKTTAPIVAVINPPIRPEPVPTPNNPKNQPPNKPPTIPTNKLITRPESPPFTNLPDRKPATIPMIINNKKFITRYLNGYYLKQIQSNPIEKSPL